MECNRDGNMEIVWLMWMCKRKVGLQVVEIANWISEHHSQNPRINSSSVIGFRTAVEDPSWKLTHTIPSSCCPLPLSAGRPSLESGRVASMILPKKSRFTFGALAFFPSPWKGRASISRAESSSPPPARYRACRASAFWRMVYFWYS